MRLKDTDIQKLINLKVGSTWSSLKSIKEINDEIKDLKIYSKKISKTCRDYLKKDVVKSKTFVISTMLEKCKQLKPKKETKAKTMKNIKKSVKIGKDAKTGVAKSTIETNTIKGKAIPSTRKQTILRNAGKIYDAINRANGDPKKAVEFLEKDKNLLKETTEGFEEALFAVISYFITDKQLASSIFIISTTILTFLAKLYGRTALEWILGKLLGVAKKLKKKGYKYFGFGDGDDDDDDDDDNNSGNAPQLNLNPELRDLLDDIENFELDDTSKDKEVKDVPPQTNQTITERQPNSMSSDSQTLQFLKQQAQQNYQSELAQARKNTDILLRSQTTPQKHTKTQSAPTTEIPKEKEPTSFKTDKGEYFKYDNVDKFKERYDADMKELRKEDKYKTFSDDDFYNKYNEKFKERTQGEDLDDMFKADKHPIKKPSVEPLTTSDDITSVNKAKVYDDMGRDLDTGVGHTTPPSFWETLQNFSPTQPLGAVAGAMALGVGAVSMMGRNLVPEAQQRTPEQMNAINRLRTIQPRVGRERILERGGRVDRYDDMPELGDVATGLIRTSARGESAEQRTQTLVPESGALGSRVEGRSSNDPELLRQLDRANNLVNMYVMGEGDEASQELADELMVRTRQLDQAKKQLADKDDIEYMRKVVRDYEARPSGNTREQRLFRKLEEREKELRQEGFRASVDIPHSHQQELALERAGRVQREGQYLVPETPVVRPSTTLTETLTQARQNVADNMEMMREMRGIQEDMDKLMGRMNEPRGDDI